MGRTLYSACVTDGMERNLNKLYSAGALDDEFFLKVSHDGKYIATGGYDKTAHVIDISATTNCAIQCKHVAKRGIAAGKI